MLPWVTILVACEHRPTTVAPDPTADTGCDTVVYEDGDGDGHGDPERAVAACAPTGTVAAVGDDCDDADPAVHPGAEEACDGKDGDCDGSPGAEERDEDGDGYRACAGDCDDTSAEVSPAAEEVCRWSSLVDPAPGADEDCDGLVDLDDDSVDAYTCGYCPDAAQVKTWTYQTRTVNPCVLDPGVSLCSTDPRYPDTHDQGNRLHRLIWRDDQPLRDELLLYLPPGPGDHNNRLLSWAAFAGYRTVSLGWQNDPLVDNCPTSECFDDVRYELLYGEDRSPYLEIAPADSVVGRLETLFEHLVAAYPGEGWDAYWDRSTGMRWDRIVVAGWSVGTGEAAYLGRFHQTSGLLLVSGPSDATADGEAAAWLSEPRATEACRQWGMYHRHEPGAGYDPPGPDLFPISLGLLGIPGPPVDADTVPAPYGEARILNTEKTGYVAPDCNPHKAMAMDECMHPDLAQMYLYAYCAAGTIRACE